MDPRRQPQSSEIYRRRYQTDQENKSISKTGVRFENGGGEGNRGGIKGLQKTEGTGVEARPSEIR